MFSSKSKPLSSPSRVSIEEANSHLKLVHQRVEQLETIISKRDQQLIQNEEIHRQEVQRLTHSYDKHCKELNRQIDSLKSSITEMESKVTKQNQIIDENSERLQKLSQIIEFVPNLDKFLQLLNGLTIDLNNSQQLDKKTLNCDKSLKNSLKFTENMNGFCHQKEDLIQDITHSSNPVLNSDTNSENSNKTTKKCVKYRINDTNLVSGVEEERVSTTSSSTTVSGRSQSVQSNGQTDCDSTEKTHNRAVNSKLRIGRSFNITSNFSDDEEVVADRRTSGRRKKITEI